MQDIMFSVVVITYNQDKYISQTLDSILKQEHGYKYEIVIGDDCSLDKTKQIIEEYVEKYPEIIKPLYNNPNKGLIKNYFNVINHCNGKYIMECAGDDYWLPGKVKKQIEFMEANPDIGMCYTKAKYWNDKLSKYEKRIFGQDVSCFETILLDGNKVPALSVCFRNELVFNYIKDVEPQKKEWLMEDVPMWLYFTYFSKIKFIDEVTAVYRVLEESASHSSDINKQLKFVNSAYDIRCFYINKFNLDYDLTTYHSRAILREYAKSLFQKYNSKVAKEFRDYYKTAIYKSKKFDLYSFLSHSVITWKFVKFLKIIFKQ